MIKICIEKKDFYISQVIIKGHSGYDVSGHDIVCAGISAIAITTVNAILKIDKNLINYEKKDGYLKIKILKQHDMVQLLIENMCSLLKEMEEKYQKYIKIKGGNL